jgi:transposase-like protein
MASLGAPALEVKLSELVQAVMAEGRAASVAVKRELLQALVDETVGRELGRARGEPKAAALAEQVSAWQCGRCASRRKADFSYSGSYRRVLAFEDGVGELHIPRVRCRCGGNVKPDFGAALPKRKRQWFDLDLRALELHVEGLGYRALKRHFSRCGCEVGIGSLSHKLADFAAVDINATVAGEHARAVGGDAAFVAVAGGLLAHYYLHEVLGREQPLIRQGKEVAWYRTGKVLACHFAREETMAGWEQTFAQATHNGCIDPHQPLYLVSDGNQGLLSAADLCLPWSVKQRCIWHIAYRARDKASEANKDAFERDALWALKAPDITEAYARLHTIAARWIATETDALQSLARKFGQGLEHLRHPELPLTPRTGGICERYNQEPKRRSRAMRGYRDQACMTAMNRLIALRHNCIIDRTDWLAHAAQSLWSQPVTDTTTQQHENPTHGPYTTEGT